MKYHYVYRITHKICIKHYYGVRTSKNIKPYEDLGITYFSSSSDKEFLQEQKTHPENFKYKVIQIFNSREEASLWEIRLHKKFNVATNESFYNKTNALSTGFQGLINEESIDKMKHTIRNYSEFRSKEVSENRKQAQNKRRLNESIENKAIFREKYINTIRKKHKDLIIKIYNPNNILVHVSKGYFREYCNTHNLPYNLFLKSYKNGGQPINSETKNYPIQYMGYKAISNTYPTNDEYFKGNYMIIEKPRKSKNTYIFNHKNELVHTVSISLNRFLKNNNLPTILSVSKYKNKPIYQKIQYFYKEVNYSGWYANDTGIPLDSVSKYNNDKSFKIINVQGEVVLETKSNLKELCKNNNINLKILMKTYLSNYRMYSDIPYKTKQKIRNSGRIDHIGYKLIYN